MPVSDISYITRTYIELIRREFVNSPAWSGFPPDILPVSPIDLKEKDGIGFYLYHVIHKKEYDNFPVPTREPETRFLPMALNLYYQLTANSSNDDENGPYNEQLMMSIAMKAIHDCPFIDDTTLVPEIPNNPPTLILNSNIRGNDNRLSISQQPVPHNDAVHNWTAGQAPMKLSAYYEVSTAFLEPDDISSYTGRVLAYGNYIFLKGAPRITSSENVITYTIPGEALSSEIKIRPAQVPPSKMPPGVALPESVISVYGAGFEGGTVSLRLLHPRFKESVIAAPEWAIAVTGSNSISLTVREKAVLERNGTAIDLLPGVYAAQVVVAKLLQLPNGLGKEFKNASNQFPFVISPRIDTPLGALAGSVLTVAGYVFQFIDSGNDVLADAIEVYTGETRLIRNDTGPFNPGEFRVTGALTMDVNIPGVLSPGMQIPFRILINGAESSPLWIII